MYDWAYVLKSDVLHLGYHWFCVRVVGLLLQPIVRHPSML